MWNIIDSNLGIYKSCVNQFYIIFPILKRQNECQIEKHTISRENE